ncbi:PRC-barrel domain-containing protein [Cohnella soli]|uniref:PRC-barrel domain-containing protein n=1 Tax=Cohnella soli TaxID=425005 RepID=A0ABW0HYD5_9BACL
MIQAQAIIGMPVLLESGKAVGKVKDLWFDEFWNLVGIVLDKNARSGFRKKPKVILWEHVAFCGADALLIRTSADIMAVSGKSLLRTFLTGVVRLKDMPVFTVEGERLGEVTDVYMKPAEGIQIIGYELTDGFLADIFEGRRRLLLPEASKNMTLGEDAILVPASCERILPRDHTWKVTGEDG